VDKNVLSPQARKFVVQVTGDVIAKPERAQTNPSTVTSSLAGNQGFTARHRGCLTGDVSVNWIMHKLSVVLGYEILGYLIRRA